MLKEQDCKVGAEIICIDKSCDDPNNRNSNGIKQLKIGHVYTIEQLLPQAPGVNFSKTGIVPTIYLSEIPDTYPANNCRCAFGLHRFKLLRKKDIQVFYDLIEKPVDKKVFESA